MHINLRTYQGKGGGRLYDIMDEVEAYERSQMFGLYAGIEVTPEWVRSLSDNYKKLPDTQLTVNSPYMAQQSMGYNIANILWRAGKYGIPLGECRPCEVIKGWKRYYMQGKNNEMFSY